MKGDKIVIEEHHRNAASMIVPKIVDAVKNKSSRYTITVAGESGSGKSETGQAIADALEKEGFKCLLLGQDDYFVHPLYFNDTTRSKNYTFFLPMDLQILYYNVNIGYDMYRMK